MSEQLATVTADLATQNEQLQMLQNSNAELIAGAVAASEWRAKTTHQMVMWNQHISMVEQRMQASFGSPGIDALNQSVWALFPWHAA